MTDAMMRQTPRLGTSRFANSKGFATIGASTILLFIVCAIFAPSSISQAALQGSIPFASVLAVVGLGQLLVVQQGGVDLSVAGGVSLAVVIVSHQPDGDSAKLLPAILMAVVFALIAGIINGALVSWLKINAIITTLGVNALLYGAVFAISGGTPRSTTALLAAVAGGSTFGIPNAALFALVTLALVAVVMKKMVAGRRFEAIGANPVAARAVGLRVRTHQFLAYVWAQFAYCLAGILLAGITNQPTAFQGDSLLLPSVTVVVLGGTSLLGGRGFPISTVIAALFLWQLSQFALALGVSYSAQTLVQAAALATGVALYSVNWGRVRTWLRQRQAPVPGPVSA